MKNRILLTIILLLFAISHNLVAQCTDGCEPNTGSAILSRTPSCYGDHYEITVDGIYGTCTLDGNTQQNCNGTFVATPGVTYSWDFCSPCSLDCVPNAYNSCINQFVYVPTTMPQCEIDINAVPTSASGFGCSDGSISVSVTTNACQGWVGSVYQGQTLVGSVSSSEPQLSGLASGNYTVVVFSLPAGCSDTMEVFVGPACSLSAVYEVQNSEASCNTGSIEITSVINSCNGWNAVLEHGIYGIIAQTPNANTGETLHLENLSPGAYNLIVSEVNSGCQQVFDIEITRNSCISPLQITSQDGSGWGCQDGSLTISETNVSCDFQITVYDETGAVYQSYFSDAYPSDLSGAREAQFTYIPSGSYVVEAVGQVNNIDNTSSVCSTYDTIVVGPLNCSINAVVSQSAGVFSGCSDGFIQIELNTNDCQGGYADLYTLDGMYIGSAFPSDGNTIRFENLLPENYLLYSYAMSLAGTGQCQQVDTISITNLGCVSPFSINTSAVSNVSCENGSVTISLINSGCNRNILITRESDASVIYSGSSSVFDYSDSIAYLTLQNLAAGLYTLTSGSISYDYYGQEINCQVVDTFFIQAPSDPPLTWYQDLDSDGFGNASVSVNSCIAPDGFVGTAGDCDDLDVSVNPGAMEVLNNDTDENCDGIAENSTCSAPVIVCQPDITVNATASCGARLMVGAPGTGNIMLNILNGTGNKYFYLSNYNFPNLRQQFSDYNFSQSNLISISAGPSGRVPYHFGGRQRIGVNNGSVGSDDLINGNDSLIFTIGSQLTGRKFTGVNLNLNSGSSGALAVITFWRGENSVGASQASLLPNSTTMVQVFADSSADRITLSALSGSYGIKGFTQSTFYLSGTEEFSNCSEVTISGGVPSGEQFFGIGSHQLTWTATDQNGQTSQCVQNINVVGSDVVASMQVLDNPNGTIIGSPVPNPVPNTIYLGYGNQTLLLRCLASGGTNLKYRWTGSFLSGTGNEKVFSPTRAGNFTVNCEVTNKIGCSEIVSVTICVMKVNNSNGTVNICSQSSTQTISVADAQQHFMLNPFDLPGSCGQSCGVQSKENEDVETIEISELNLDLKVFPNPSSSGLFELRLNTNFTSLGNITVYDLLGSLVFKADASSLSSTMIDLSQLNDGCYIAKVEFGGLNKEIRLIKAH